MKKSTLIKRKFRLEFQIIYVKSWKKKIIRRNKN